MFQKVALKGNNDISNDSWFIRSKHLNVTTHHMRPPQKGLQFLGYVTTINTYVTVAIWARLTAVK